MVHFHAQLPKALVKIPMGNLSTLMNATLVTNAMSMQNVLTLKAVTTAHAMMATLGMVSYAMISTNVLLEITVPTKHLAPIMMVPTVALVYLVLPVTDLTVRM